MRDHQKEFPVGMMCKVFNISRSGLYPSQKWSGSNRDNENRMLLSEIMRIHQDSKASYGSPRITQELNIRGFKASRPRVARQYAGKTVHSVVVTKHKKHHPENKSKSK